MPAFSAKKFIKTSVFANSLHFHQNHHNHRMLRQGVPINPDSEHFTVSLYYLKEENSRIQRKASCRNIIG